MKNIDDRIRRAVEIVADESTEVAALIDTADDFRIVWANRRLKDFLKTAAVAPEGMRWGGRCPFAFGINAIAAMNQVIATGEPIHIEEQPFGARVSNRFGETTYWNWKILPAPSDECPSCVLVMAENVTDRVARKALEQGREPHFSGVVLDLPVGVATIDPHDYRILDANDIWLSYLSPECQTRDSIGRTLPECVSDFEGSGLKPIIERVVGTRELFTASELEIKDPARGSIWWNITLRFVEVKESREAILMTAWDVTEHVNARKLADSARQRALALLKVQTAITSSLALDQMLGLITDSTRELVSSTAAAVLLLTENGEEFLVPVASSGMSVQSACVVPLDLHSSLAARALRERRPVTLVGPEAAKLQCLAGILDGRPVLSVASAPIVAEGRMLGVIEAYSDAQRRFTNDELEALHSLAGSAATAIVNAKLFQASSDAHDELVVRSRTIDNERKLLIAILDSLPEAVAVADASRRLVRANEAARNLYTAKEGEELSITDLTVRMRPQSVDGRDLSPEEHPLLRALSGEAFLNEEYVVHDVSDEPRFRSVSGAAVRDPVGNVVYGVTIGRDITEQKLLQSRLEAALEREQKIAQTLQRALMSEVPAYMSGFRLAAVYEAGLREAEIGGDFFDIFSPRAGTVAIVIGDVAGKGLGAAIQIASAKYGIRSYAYQDASPAHVVALMNESMYREPPDGGFVSMFYAIVDVEAQTLTFANAGHEPPLLRRRGGQVERLLSNGIVLGVRSGMEYEEGRTDIYPGDRLLLYTDGITEARKDGGEMLGEDRLREYWSACGEANAADALDRVYHWARDFSEGHFHDDVAMMVIAREDG